MPCRLSLKLRIYVSACNSKIGDYFYNRQCAHLLAAHLLFKFLFVCNTQNDRTYGLFNDRKVVTTGKSGRTGIINAPIYWCIKIRSTLRWRRCGPNSPRELRNSFELADYFQVWIASLFALRWFGAQINLRIVSKKVLSQSNRLLILLLQAGTPPPPPPPPKKKKNFFFCLFFCFL